MSDERSPLAAGAWAALLQVHAALVPSLDRALQRAAGLPLSWYDVLLELAAAPGRRLTMSELSERVVLSRTRVSRLVTELEGRGLVTRETNPADGRSAYVAITAAGRQRLHEATPHHHAVVDQHFAGLAADELGALATALHKVLADDRP